MAHELIDGDILHVVFSGRLTGADLSAALDELERAEAGYPQARDQLIDLSAVTKDDLTGADIEQTVLRHRSHRLQNPVRSAFVAPNSLDYGMARMFQIRNQQPDILIGVFHTLAEAQAWLEERVPARPAA